MEQKELALLQEFENLHKEFYSIRSSRIYRIGLKVSKFIDSVRKGTLLKYIHTERSYRMIAKYNHMFPKSSFDYGDYPDILPRIAVYTCVTGGYDTVELPKLMFPNIDYILFTDNVSKKNPVWDVRPLPLESKNQPNNTLKSRYCKMHPQIVGKEYDYAFFIDGNICIYSNITNMINAINKITGLAIHRHSVRNCIYEELEACIIAKRGKIEEMRNQVASYKKEGFPKQFGLLETTVVLTDLKNPVALDILDGCWHELATKSTRDQLGLPYAIWKRGYKIDDIGNLGYNLMINPKFRKVSHAKCIDKKEE